MTGNLLLDTLISLTAIAIMVLLARLLFPAPVAKVTEAEARDRLVIDEPDFTPDTWLIDEHGTAALAEGANGEFVLVKKVGLDLATRRFKKGDMQVGDREGDLVLKSSDVTLPEVRISNPEAKVWALKLSSQSDK